MVMEFTNIEMGLFIMGSIKMIKKMGLVIINGLMGGNMWVGGQKVNIMDLVCIMQMKYQLSMVYGNLVIILNGLTKKQ